MSVPSRPLGLGTSLTLSSFSELAAYTTVTACMLVTALEYKILVKRKDLGLFLVIF